MHVAAAKGYTQLLEMLIKAGGNVRGHDRDGWTPLHAAAHWAERDSCKILLEHGASTLDQNYAEKNTRIAHEEHTLSTEYKRELQHRDQTSENDVLHSISKAPLLFDKSSSVDSQSSQDSQQQSEDDRALLADKNYEVDTEIASSARSSEERSVTERSSILTNRTSVSYDRSASSEKSMSVDSQRSSSVISTASSVTTSQNTSDGSSCSVQSGDQHVSCTVPMPRPLQQPNSWINRGVHLITSLVCVVCSVIPSVQKSLSTPSNLPWASLCRTSNGADSLRSPPQSSAFTQFLTHNRVSAFRPIKASHPTERINELPRGLHPQHLNPSKMRSALHLPWQSNAVNESEAERRNTARMQRQHRRSTQGVTKEQLEEASRLAAEDSARRRGSDVHSTTSKTVSASSNTQREPAAVRLASEERDSTSMTASGSSSSSLDRVGATPKTANAVLRESSERIDRSVSERLSESRTSPPTTSVTLSLPNVPSPGHTPSAAGLRRKSQGMSLSRSNRRGTGPVLAEDVHAAVSARSLASDPAPLSLRYAPGSALSATYSRPLITPTGRSDIVRGSASTTQSERSLEKSHSAPPSHPPPAAPSAVAGLRSVAVTPAAVGRVQSRVAGHPTVSTVSTYPTSQSVNSRPSETNLNYKALYEKEKLESERLRKEMDELKRTHDNGSVSSFRVVSSRFRNGSPAGSLPMSKSASGISLDENERRSMERKISDLEIQLKGLNQLRMENQRLKEENGALVRVISKMTI
uniref:ANK_REP_REGION domain-containing protein n=1 Tax=Heterorhabditis bacteriophora TaxID=37862 RepID=A0A1I7X9D2_HETBA